VAERRPSYFCFLHINCCCEAAHRENTETERRRREEICQSERMRIKGKLQKRMKVGKRTWALKFCSTRNGFLVEVNFSNWAMRAVTLNDKSEMLRWRYDARPRWDLAAADTATHFDVSLTPSLSLGCKTRFDGDNGSLQTDECF
jgi:hypothetical protein